jgi:hypothetical protein
MTEAKLVHAEFSPPHCLRLLQERRHDALSEYFIAFLDRFNSWHIDEMDEEKRVFFDTVMIAFMTCLTDPGYVIDKPQIAVRFILHNENIANLAALSCFKTTDAALGIVVRQADSFVKTLILYSARNSLRLDMKAFFDFNPKIASLWYFAFIGWDFGKLADRNALDHLRRHFTMTDQRLLPVVNDLQHAYFCVTYAAPEAEETVKRTLNRIIREHYAPAAKALMPRPKPDPKHVAVLSSNWFAAHSVHRTNARFVESLKGHYRLTLVALPSEVPPDTSLFDQVIEMKDVNDFTPLRGLDAIAAFYPDVGMSLGSIVLSNFRLAPVQIMSCGHPVSTFGSEIDFFLGGADIETGESARKFYSERLLLIPGRGVAIERLTFSRDIPEKPQEPVRILLSWAAQKVNHDMLQALKRVADRCQKRVEFHFFSGVGMRFRGRPVFLETAREVLGKERTVVHPLSDAKAYFEAIGHMHLAADSHPFGGFNTVLDPLYMGMPVAGFEGERAFAKYGPHLLRKLGLGELVAADMEAYVDLLVRLVEDAGWRRDLERKIRAIDFDQTVFAETNGQYFRHAVDYLIAHPEERGPGAPRSPIRIGA